ncbi:MAG: hydroxyacid dehydrogenase [Rhodospirillales bacterium]|nr:hydroxyacid dehydrogenase [Rhodospirillales bacterium]
MAELEQFAAIVGSGNVLSASDAAPYLQEQRGRYVGDALAVVRPGTTDEVAAVVRTCAQLGVSIVPQGGNTGLVGGGVPSGVPRSIVLSTRRLDRIRDVDALGSTMTVEAGVVLQRAREAADAADRLLPLTLGAEGSCTVGGVLSTNAGGHLTLAYGNARALALGLEVVLPDGRVWNGLSRLRKDNTGYDLKQLFLGAEGTLGIVTAAVLALQPKPRDVATGFVGLRDPDAAVELLARLQDATGGAIVAFELMPRLAIDFATAHVAGAFEPISARTQWYVLLEATSGVAGAARAALEQGLAGAIEDGLVDDAVLAESGEQRRRFWFMREAIVEAQKFEGASIKHDISVPVALVPEFIRRADAAVETVAPGARPYAFGHVGDGNVHYNITQPPGLEPAAWMARWDELNAVVHAIVADLEGSISAEHGIGRFKRDALPGVKSAVEFDLLQTVKRALDPDGRMNPGAMF